MFREEKKNTGEGGGEKRGGLKKDGGVCVCEQVYVCVCVCERERERERGGQGWRSKWRRVEEAPEESEEGGRGVYLQ